jgi:hypothetical protein
MKYIYILTAILSLNSAFAEVDKDIMFDYSGLTIFKDGKISADTIRWNLKSVKGRSIYTPNGINKHFKGSIEIAKDENGKIIGVKNTQGTQKNGQQVYYLNDGIVEIKNGQGKAYTYEGCSELSKRYTELKKCSDLTLELSDKYEISKENLKHFPEFPQENIVYGKSSKESDTATYSAGAELMKIFARCEEYFNYAEDKKIKESVEQRAQELSVQAKSVSK